MPAAADSSQVNVTSPADCGRSFIQWEAAWSAQKINGVSEFTRLAQNVIQEMGHDPGFTAGGRMYGMVKVKQIILEAQIQH
jgi:hypothetical protein